MLQTWTLENKFLGFRNIDDHFVVSSPLPDMFKFTQDLRQNKRVPKG